MWTLIMNKLETYNLIICAKYCRLNYKSGGVLGLQMEHNELHNELQDSLVRYIF